MQSTVWDEAVKIAGADPDFHRRDLFEAHRRGRLPRVGAGGAAVHRRTRPTSFPFDHLDADQADSRGAGAAAGDRPHGARPLARQLFCRDRAGGVLPVAPGARHRFLATTRCCRAGCSRTWTRSCRAWARPNFAQIPINAPKCPFAQPAARRPHADAAAQGPCGLRAQHACRPTRRVRSQAQGLRQRGAGRRRRTGRVRAESFADHYSQARQFLRSQSEPEQAHMASALVFELSKVEHPHVREAMVGHLLRDRRRPGPARGRRPGHGRRCRRAATPAEPVQDLATLAGAAHHRQRMKPTLARALCRHPGRRRLGRYGRSPTLKKARGKGGRHASRSWRPRWVASR